MRRHFHQHARSVRPLTVRPSEHRISQPYSSSADSESPTTGVGATGKTGPFLLPNQWNTHGGFTFIDDSGAFHAVMTKQGPCAWLQKSDVGYQPFMCGQRGTGFGSCPPN